MSEKISKSKRVMTPDEATRNVDPQRVSPPLKAWTREDFLRDLRQATRRDETEDEDPQAKTA